MADNLEVWAIWIAVASLVWNVINTGYTKSVDTGARKRALDLDEFRSSVKQPIEAALVDLEDCEVRVDMYCLSHSDLSAQQDDLISLNRSITTSMLTLLKRLESADHSNFTNENHWSDFYYAKEDPILDAMNTATNKSALDADRKAGLQSAAANLKVLRRSITALLETHIQSM